MGVGIKRIGQGLVFGAFEAAALVESEFNGWQKKYPFQVKLRPLQISNNPLAQAIAAKVLQDKIQMQKAKGGSPNLLELSEKEFEQIKKAVKEMRKEIVFG